MADELLYVAPCTTAKVARVLTPGENLEVEENVEADGHLWGKVQEQGKTRWVMLDA